MRQLNLPSFINSQSERNLFNVGSCFFLSESAGDNIRNAYKNRTFGNIFTNAALFSKQILINRYTHAQQFFYKQHRVIAMPPGHTARQCRQKALCAQALMWLK